MIPDNSSSKPSNSPCNAPPLLQNEPTAWSFWEPARPVSGDLKDTVSLTTGGGGSIGGDRE